MKLFKRILPLTGIACVAATATPLAVSCTNNATSSFSIDGLEVFEKGYKRKTDCLPLAYMSEEEISTKYLTDIKENPQIFYDDMVQYLLDSEEPTDSTVSLTYSVNLRNVDIENNRVSFDLRIKSKAERKSGDDVTVTTSDRVMKYSNMRIVFEEKEIINNAICFVFGYKWGNTPPIGDYIFLQNDDQWSVTINSSRVIEKNGIITTSLTDTTFNSTSSDAALSQIYSSSISPIKYVFKANYLKNIKINQEESK